MKLHLTIELSLKDKTCESEILSHLIPATQKLEQSLPKDAKAELVNISLMKCDSLNKKLDSELTIINLDNIQINFNTKSIKVNDVDMPITPIEFKLLSTMAARRGIVQTRDILFKDVWNINPTNKTKTLDVHIKRLRNKLGNNIIHTVPGVGYIIK